MAKKLKALDLRPLHPRILEFIRATVTQFAEVHREVDVRTILLECDGAGSDYISLAVSFDTPDSSDVLLRTLETKLGMSRQKAETYLSRDEQGTFIDNTEDLTYPDFGFLELDDFENPYWEREMIEVIGHDGQRMRTDPATNGDSDMDRALRVFLAGVLKDATLVPLLKKLRRAVPFRVGVASHDGDSDFWLL